MPQQIVLATARRRWVLFRIGTLSSGCSRWICQWPCGIHVGQPAARLQQKRKTSLWNLKLALLQRCRKRASRCWNIFEVLPGEQHGQGCRPRTQRKRHWDSWLMSLCWLSGGCSALSFPQWNFSKMQARKLEIAAKDSSQARHLLRG